jgi:adenylate cyclase
MTGRRLALPFWLGLLGLLGLVLLPLVGALLGIGWYATTMLEEAVLGARIRALESTISTLADQGFQRVSNSQQALADSGIYDDGGSTEAAPTSPQWRALQNMLSRHPNMAAAYVGRRDGSFLYVARLDRLADSRRREIGGPADAVLATRRIHGAGADRAESWTFVDAAGTPTAGPVATAPGYDPRERGWFAAAIAAGRPIITEPYEFAGAGGIGITVATPLSDGAAVLGADMTLATVSRVLGAYKVSPSSLIVLGTDTGGILAQTDLPAGPQASDLADHARAQIAALAAAGRETLVDVRDVGGAAIRLQARALPPVLGRRFYLAIAAPVAELTVETRALIKRSALVAVAAILLAFAGGMLAARFLSRPLARIASKTDQFRQLDFSDASRIDSRVSEIRQLDQAVEQMRGGLEQFGRYVPRQLVRRVIESPGGAVVGGIRQPVTVLFTDIAGFSQTAEAMEPEQLVQRLSKYLESLGGIVMKHGGTIDKYIGDSIMALWNAPNSDIDHIANACRAALAAADASRWLEAKWTQRGRPPFQTRCGLHTGTAIVGNIGSLDRMNYTVVGAVPNAASRIESLNKVYGTRVLASGEVVAATREQFVWRDIDRVVPAGMTLAIDVHELVGLKQAGDSPAQAESAVFLNRWHAALALYRRGDMEAAGRTFRDLARDRPDDTASRVFAARCEQFVETGVPDAWNGVTVFREK